MNSIGFTEEECIKSLTSFICKIDEIMELIDAGLPLGSQEKQKAQETMRFLKNDLERDYKIRSTLKGQEKMTDIEASSYYPAIHEALTCISVKYNSIPSEEWFNQLYDSKGSLSYYLGQLKND